MDSMMVMAGHVMKAKSREQRRRESPDALDRASAGFSRSMMPVVATFAGIAAFATMLTFA